jgi:hypothetical protein
MSVATTVTLGYGTFGSASLTVTLGYSTQTEVQVVTPPDLVPVDNSDLTRRRISFQPSATRIGQIWKGRQ